MVCNKSHFLVLLQGSGAGEKLLLVYFLVISDSGIRTCLHLVVVLLVKRARGVHTQVKQSLFPGLPYLAFHHLHADRKLGGNLGARLISNLQVCYSNDCETVLGL